MKQMNFISAVSEVYQASSSNQERANPFLLYARAADLIGNDYENKKELERFFAVEKRLHLLIRIHCRRANVCSLQKDYGKVSNLLSEESYHNLIGVLEEICGIVPSEKQERNLQYRRLIGALEVEIRRKTSEKEQISEPQANERSDGATVVYVSEQPKVCSKTENHSKVVQPEPTAAAAKIAEIVPPAISFNHPKSRKKYNPPMISFYTASVDSKKKVSPIAPEAVVPESVPVAASAEIPVAPAPSTDPPNDSAKRKKSESSATSHHAASAEKSHKKTRASKKNVQPKPVSSHKLADAVPPADTPNHPIKKKKHESLAGVNGGGSIEKSPDEMLNAQTDVKIPRNGSGFRAFLWYLFLFSLAALIPCGKLGTPWKVYQWIVGVTVSILILIVGILLSRKISHCSFDSCLLVLLVTANFVLWCMWREVYSVVCFWASPAILIYGIYSLIAAHDWPGKCKWIDLICCLVSLGMLFLNYYM